ncbi:MAG: hypothetical protein PHF56_24580 [Desulfuromonadaceae bacterium]|nr:hypothetical protein [Desulfuromonadaceae bacterium]
MGKPKNNLKDVISVRITEKEKMIIRNMAIKNKINITCLMRDLIFASGLVSPSPAACS